MNHLSRTKHDQNSSPHSFPLALAATGESVRIVCVHGGCSMQKKMLSMGLAADDVVEVVQHRNKGALLISKNGNRYAFGGGMAHKINVVRV